LEKIRVFCLPFAGGAASYYRKWVKFLDPRLELHPLELAGRGKRYLEPHYAAFDDMVEDCRRLILSQGGTGPYLLFGHSMGAFLAYKICERLAALGQTLPSQVIVSSKSAPNAPEAHQGFDTLSDQEFVAKLQELGGIPPELVGHQELLDLILPVFRNDVRILVAAERQSQTHVMDIPLTVLHGRRDQETRGDIRDWSAFSSRGMRLHSFEGGHFFINEEIQEVLRVIAECAAARPTD
jgi:surfactin synthase thioesterase subunit